MALFSIQKLVQSSTYMLVALGVAVSSQTASSEIPEGYYDSVNLSSPELLRNSLHEIIDDHQRFPYTASSTDTWDILESADQNPDNETQVITIYQNRVYAKVGGGNNDYNREHSWPKSYGFAVDGDDNSAYTDAHHLFIADADYNYARSNKPFSSCDVNCVEYVTDVNNAQGGSGQSNWTNGEYTEGNWETWIGRRGDVARAMMYMAVRYEGGNHGTTGFSEPDLILTNDRNLIASSQSSNNLSVAYMGMLDTLLQWHRDDPVDEYEQRRNDVVYSFQGNRNPFVDHPEYANCLFESNCQTDSQSPAMPSGLTGSSAIAEVTLTWDANSEADLAGYLIYRSDSTEGDYLQINSTAITEPVYIDQDLAEGSLYFYKVAARDYSGNLSQQTEPVEVTTLINQPPVAEFSLTVNGLEVSLSDLSHDPEGSPLSWLWDFGNGQESQAQNPAVTYSAGGEYTISLTVTDPHGKSDSVSQRVQLSEATTGEQQDNSDQQAGSGGGSHSALLLGLLILLRLLRSSKSHFLSGVN